jgi:hypothetical protein
MEQLGPERCKYIGLLKKTLWLKRSLSKKPKTTKLLISLISFDASSFLDIKIKEKILVETF